MDPPFVVIINQDFPTDTRIPSLHHRRNSRRGWSLSPSDFQSQISSFVENHANMIYSLRFDMIHVL
ncbi:unnamed protein product [Brassica rapa subsp. trilocularis]